MQHTMAGRRSAAATSAVNRTAITVATGVLALLLVSSSTVWPWALRIADDTPSAPSPPSSATQTVQASPLVAVVVTTEAIARTAPKIDGPSRTPAAAVQVAKVVEVASSDELDGIGDCDRRLRNVRYVPPPGAKEALAAIGAAVRHERSVVSRQPKYQWRRYDIPHRPEYLAALRLLGAYGEASSEQQSQAHWAERAPDAVGFVRLHLAGPPRRGGGRGRVDARGRPLLHMITDRPFDPRDAWRAAAAAAATAAGAEGNVSADDVVDVPLSHPVVAPLHGSVSPARLLLQSAFLARLTGIAGYLDHPSRKNAAEGGRSSSDADNDLVVVEMGAGNGGLLYGMCPPHERTRCYGTDFAAALVSRGNAALRELEQSRILLRQSCFAGHVATGDAAAVVSHAVMTYLKPDQACRHVAEALRMLRPGGRAVFWMLSRRWLGTRYHPSFFVDVEDDHERRGDSYGWRRDGGTPAEAATTSDPTMSNNGTADDDVAWRRRPVVGSRRRPPVAVVPLSRCSPELGTLVDVVRVYDQANEADGPAIYPPTTRFFGAVLERNAAPWPSSLDEAAAQPSTRSPQTFAEATPASKRRYATVVKALSLVTFPVQLPADAKKP